MAWTLLATMTACAMMVVGGAGAAIALPSSGGSSAIKSGERASSDARYKQMVSGVNVINRIPDRVLRLSDEAADQWIEKHYGNIRKGASLANAAACTGAIALTVASTAFPAAKLLKIKKLIKGLGGVKEAAQVMWGASSSYEKVRALGGAAGALAAELVGITAVKEACFS